MDPPQTQAPQRSILLPLAVLFGCTVTAQLLSLAFGRSDPEKSFAAMVLPSVLFVSIISLPAILFGLTLGPRMGLGAPLLEQLLSRKPGALHQVGEHVRLACFLGVALGGLLLVIRKISGPYLPPEIPAYGHRGILGGLSVSLGAAVAEEVWFRLGLMTLMVWWVARMVRKRTPPPMVIWTIILISSVAFGMAHLPQLMANDAGSPFAIAGTVLGNTAVGTLFGWCYWKRSLIAAMAAHFFVDLMLHVLPALAP